MFKWIKKQLQKIADKQLIEERKAYDKEVAKIIANSYELVAELDAADQYIFALENQLGSAVRILECMVDALDARRLCLDLATRSFIQLAPGDRTTGEVMKEMVETLREQLDDMQQPQESNEEQPPDEPESKNFDPDTVSTPCNVHEHMVQYKKGEK